MPAKRVLMRKIKRILELRFMFKLSKRAIARNVGGDSLPFMQVKNEKI